MPTPSSPWLSGVWGSSASNVFAVGDNGTILRYDGNRWNASASGVTTSLYAIWGTDGNNKLPLAKAARHSATMDELGTSYHRTQGRQSR